MQKTIEFKIAIIAGIFSLLGAAIGSGMTIFFSGYTESEKISVSQKKNAVDAFIEAAWENPNNKDKLTTQYFTMLNKLSVYAPDSLIDALSSYHSTKCSDTSDEKYECKVLWAKVVQEIRKLSGSDEVSDETIITLLWWPDALTMQSR